MKKKPILWYGSAITEKLLIKKCYRAGGAEIIWDLKKKAEIFTTVSLEGARIKKKLLSTSTETRTTVIVQF